VVVKIVRSAARPGSSCAKLPRVLRGLPGWLPPQRPSPGSPDALSVKVQSSATPTSLPVGVLAGVQPCENSPAYDRRDTPLWDDFPATHPSATSSPGIARGGPSHFQGSGTRASCAAGRP